MNHRHSLTDVEWARIENRLPGSHGPKVVAVDDRRFVDAVLWIARTGAVWADLPPRLGLGNSQWRRFTRWCKSGEWDVILAVLKRPELDRLVFRTTNNLLRSPAEMGSAD